MALRIKNEETCRLAAELAELTGETKTEAITVALRERLERQRHGREAEVEARLERMRTIAKEAAALLRNSSPPLADGEELSITHGDYLHDEHGLPKGGGNFALTDIETV